MPDARAAIAASGTPLGRGTKRVPWDERSDAVVKETRRRGPLTRWALPSRAKRAFEAARALEAAGVKTAAPLACIEEGAKAFFIARFVAGRRLDVASEGAAAAALCANLHAAFVVHGDFKPANLLVSSEGITVIDLDASRVLGAVPSRRARARDLGALVAYSERTGASRGPAIIEAYLAAASFETDRDALIKAVETRRDLKLARWAKA